MKLSMWTSYFVEETPEESLKLLANTGWRYAELSDEHSRVLLERGAPEATGLHFAAFASALGVAVDQGHLDLPVDIAPGSERERRRAVDGLKPWFDLYNAIGIRAGVLHPGGGGHQRKGLSAERLKSLSEISDYLSGSGLVVCLENCNSGDELKPLLDATDPNRVGVCLDTGHLNLTDEDPTAFIASIGPRLKALHLAENAGKMDEHTLPFARGGSVPWQEIACALRSTGYDGLLNFEIPGENRCHLAVRKLKLNYLRALAEWIFADASD